MKAQQRNRLAIALAAAMLFVLDGNGGRSQTTRTIKIVVPTPPGGGSDVLARLLAEQIGRSQSVTMVIENRPGGGNVIGFEAVSRAAPDGNTLLLNTNAFVIIPHLRKLSYDTLTGFEPICYLANSPALIAVNSASPYRTLSDLLDAARARPGELTLASVGPATPFHIGFEILKRAAKANITYVPYPGATPAINALLGQHVTAMFATYSNVAGQLQSGLLRALAAATPQRIEPLPHVPTVAESGYKDYEVDIWFGLVAPAKTPKESIVQLAGWFQAAMQAPEVKTKLELQGLYPRVICGADFGALLRKQYDEYGSAIRESNLKAE